MSRGKGQENFEKLKAYLETVDAVPSRNGKVSISAVAAAAGVDRLSIYRNEDRKSLIAAAAAEKGLVAIEERMVSASSKTESEKALERHVKALEARNAALSAEVDALRDRLRRFEHMEDLMIEGRRVIP